MLRCLRALYEYFRKLFSACAVFGCAGNFQTCALFLDAQTVLGTLFFGYACCFEVLGCFKMSLRIWDDLLPHLSHSLCELFCDVLLL